MTSETAIVEFVEDEQQDVFLEAYGKYQQSKFKKLKNYVEGLCKDEENLLTFKGKNIHVVRAP